MRISFDLDNTLICYDPHSNYQISSKESGAGVVDGSQIDLPVKLRPDPRRQGSCIRGAISLICAFACFFSSVLTTFGIIITGQTLNDEIPKSTIQAILGHPKGRIEVRLINGRKAYFPASVLSLRTIPIELMAGDEIEKKRDSFVYTLNGQPITDIHWMLQSGTFPIGVQICLGIHFGIGAMYVLAFRRTPLSDFVDAFNPSRLKSQSQSIRTGLGILFAQWLAMSLVFTIGIACLLGCLAGLANAIRQ